MTRAKAKQKLPPELKATELVAPMDVLVYLHDRIFPMRVSAVYPMIHTVRLYSAEFKWILECRYNDAGELIEGNGYTVRVFQKEA